LSVISFCAAASPLGMFTVVSMAIFSILPA
jgi:hypothetical protein